MQRSALCRSRRELSNEYLLAKIGVDTAENEPLEVWGKIQFTIHFTPYSGRGPRGGPAGREGRRRDEAAEDPDEAAEDPAADPQDGKDAFAGGAVVVSLTTPVNNFEYIFIYIFFSDEAI